jgi:chaperonin cofactor prefoldin
MNIHTSDDYKTETNIRRKFGVLAQSLSSLSNDIETMLTSANAMRRSLSTAALSLAEIEAIYVDQTHEKRKGDAMLHTAQDKLNEMIERVKERAAQGRATLEKAETALTGLSEQATRVVTEPYILDKDEGPIEDLEYVTLDFFMTELSMSEKQVRRLLTLGSLPMNDTVEKGVGNRPRRLWCKTAAVSAVAAIRANAKGTKKGIAALI